MHLAGFLIAGPVAHSHALWRNPAHPVPFLSTEYYVEIARILERGRFDLIFFADRLAIADRYGNDKTIGIRHGDQDSTRMDPMPILGALAATTRHLGLGATRSTTYDQPYHLAREFRTLDHLSNGRAAWNVVTSMNDGEALNFGIASHLDHDQRYDRADEFMQLIGKLWDGRTFAAKWAEVIFNISPTREHMRRSAAGVREEAARLGRPEGACKVLAAVMPFVGATEAEAREKRDRVNALVDPLVGLSTLSAHSNVDLAALDLDAPVEDLRSSGTQSLIAMAARIAKDQHMTLRDIGRRYGESIMVPQLCGTGRQIAEQLEDIFTSGDADGFVISPALLPDSFADFVASVVPDLQRMGVFRREYEAQTLRGHLQDQ